jgi:N-acetylglucosamine malate deacetylase 2
MDAERFLAALADAGRGPIASAQVAVVVAHPDDETIGCGAQLPRLSGATLVLVTDGAPKNLADARAAGFATAKAYADARNRELAAALTLAGVPADALVRLGIPDQQAALRLAELTRRLVDLLSARSIRIVLTHAYEGGHPDHDATALAVCAAARLLRARGGIVSVIEMPYYRLDGAGEAFQSFGAAPDCPETTLRLHAREQALKRAMMAAHATQERVLASFGADTERFRVAPSYDFTALPNQGQLFYERQDWGMTGQRWRGLAQAALRELGLGSG